MDIQDTKEQRQAFDEWHYEQYLLENPNIDISNAKYIYDYAHKNVLVFQLKESHFTAWQAAKAQAVPEGFVVLKISDVREILSNASDAMDAESPSSVFTQTGIPSTWYDHHLVAEKNILDAIKAQEPTND